MIGQIKKTITDGIISIVGEISTYSLNTQIRLEPADDRRNDDSPTHTVLMKSPVHGKYFAAGAAWEGNHAQHGPYFSLKIEVPEISAQPMNLIAGQGREPGTYVIRYAKEKAQQQSQAAA